MSWQQVFCGREAELTLLKEAWKRISKTGENKPEVIILEAESGLGKSRLLQEFYQWLSQNCDLENYWPERISVEDRKTLDPMGNATENHGPKSGKKIPFLWWGMVLSDSGNSSVASQMVLEGAEGYFTYHMDPIIQKLAEKNAQREVKKIVGKKSIDILFAVADKALFSVPGMIKAGTESMMAVIDASDKLLTARENRPPKSEIFAALLEKFVTHNKANDNEGFMGLVGDQPVPLVLVIDDAQFCKAQPQLVEMVELILKRAAKAKWPILLICTTWQTEWHQHKESDEKTLAKLLKDTPDGWTQQERELGKLKPVELAPCLEAALPGLTKKQKQEILKRCDGSPLFLHDMIIYLQGEEGLFEDMNIENALNQEGEDELKECLGLDFEKFVSRRIKKLPEITRQALTLSSLQSMQFLKDLTMAVARRVEEDIEEDVATGLKESERPYSFIESLGDIQAEFKQRVYLDQAFKDLRNCFAPDDVKQALEDELFDRWQNRQTQEVQKQGQEDSAEDHRLILKLTYRMLKDSQPQERREAAAEAAMTIAAQQYDDWNFDSAIDYYDSAIEIWADIKKKLGDGITPDMLDNLARAHRNRGKAHGNLGQYGQAVREYDKAICTFMDLGDKASPKLLNGLAQSLMNRGYALLSMGHKYKEAIGDFDKLIELHTILRDNLSHQTSLEMSNVLVSAYDGKGSALQCLGENEQAIGAYDQAIEILGKLKEDMGDDIVPDMLDSLASVHSNRGSALHGMGKNELAIGAFDGAIKISEMLRDDLGDQITPMLLNNMAVTLMNKGIVLGKLVGGIQLAHISLQQAVDIWDELKVKMQDNFPPSWQDMRDAVAYAIGAVLR